MTLKQYLLIMSFATALCWGAWGFILVNIDPFQDASLGFIFFYIALFFSLVGTGSLVSFIFLRFFSQDYLVLRNVQKSFVIGVVTAFVGIAVLLLQAKQLLNWWSILTLVLVGVFMTLFRMSTRFLQEG